MLTRVTGSVVDWAGGVDWTGMIGVRSGGRIGGV
jgi:hypothetical protein